MFCTLFLTCLLENSLTNKCAITVIKDEITTVESGNLTKIDRFTVLESRKEIESELDNCQPISMVDENEEVELWSI